MSIREVLGDYMCLEFGLEDVDESRKSSFFAAEGEEGGFYEGDFFSDGFVVDFKCDLFFLVFAGKGALS